MKKFLSLVLAVCMIMSIASVAFAATGIADKAGLIAALTTSGEYELSGDVTLDEQVIVPAGIDVTINLNGKTLTLDYSANYAIVAKGDLTIEGNGTVEVVSPYGISTGYNSTGSVTVDGGTFTASAADGYLFGCFGGTITINSGVFEGEYCVVNNFAPYYGVNGTVVINGGDFSVSDPDGYTVVALDGSGDVVSDAITVNSGSFSDNVTDYLASGLEQDATGIVIGNAGGTQVNPVAAATKPVKGDGLVNDEFYTYSKDTGLQVVTTDTVPFGTTLYVVLTAEDGTPVKSDAVKGLSVSDKWTKNGSYVKDVEIVKVGNHYAIAIETTGSSLEEVQVLGNLAVKGKSLYKDAQGKAQKADVKFDVDVEIGLAYDEGTVDDVIALDNGEKAIYDFEDCGYDEVTVNFGELSAEVSTKGMKKVLFAYDDEENEDIYDAYSDADLIFVNCVANFRRTAEVTVALAEGEYFYEIVDGKLVEVDGEYDSWTEEFIFKTRKLGSYVISDTELSVEEVVVANPSTGAAA